MKWVPQRYGAGEELRLPGGMTVSVYYKDDGAYVFRVLDSVSKPYLSFADAKAAAKRYAKKVLEDALKLLEKS